MYDFEVGQEVVIVNTNHRDNQPYPAKIVGKGRKYFKVQMLGRVYDMEKGTNVIIKDKNYTPDTFAYPTIEIYQEYLRRLERIRKIKKTVERFDYGKLTDEVLGLVERIFKVNFPDTPT